MINKFFLLVLSIVVLAISAYAQPDCDCWQKTMHQNGLDYSEVVKEMEKAFIDHHYLKNGKPESYMELMDSIISRNEYYFSGVEFNPVLVQAFENCFLINTCNEKIREMNNRLAENRDISPNVAFSDFKDVFGKNEFRSFEVRHYFLTFYFASILPVVHLGIIEPEVQLPSVKNNKPLVPRNIMKIYVATKDSIFVNDSVVTFSDLKEIVIRHISDTSNSPNSPEVEVIMIENLGNRKISNHIILLITDRSTSYDLYVKVQDELISAYNEVRNRIGLKEFGVNYENMRGNSKKYEKEIEIIRTILPLRISEEEPVSGNE